MISRGVWRHRRSHSDSWRMKVEDWGRREEGECALVAGGRRRKIAETSQEEGPRYDDVTSWVRRVCEAERRHAKLCLAEACVSLLDSR